MMALLSKYLMLLATAKHAACLEAPRVDNKTMSVSKRVNGLINAAYFVNWFVNRFLASVYSDQMIGVSTSATFSQPTSLPRRSPTSSTPS